MRAAVALLVSVFRRRFGVSMTINIHTGLRERNPHDMISHMKRCIYIGDQGGASVTISDQHYQKAILTPASITDGTRDFVLEKVSSNFGPIGGVLLTDAEQAEKWGITKADMREGWKKFRVKGQPVVNLCVLDWCVRDFKHPLIADTAPDTTASMALWHELTGTPWYGSGQLAGDDMLEHALRDFEKATAIRDGKRIPVVRKLKDGPEGAEEMEYLKSTYDHVGDVESSDLIGYDAKRMYLAAQDNAMVCPWNLKRTDSRPFDKRLAGWWLIDVPTWDRTDIPHPAGYGEAQRWVTTPTLELLYQLAREGMFSPPAVLDSWTGIAKPLLKPWATKLNQAWLAGQDADDEHDGQRVALGAKAAFRGTNGMLNRQTAIHYRPDWHYTVIALARVNLWRKMRKAVAAGRPVLRVDTDCVVFERVATDRLVLDADGKVLEHNGPEGFAYGTGLGQFEIKEY